MNRCGFSRLVTNQGAFVRDDQRGKMILAAHVDDMLLVAEHEETAIEFVQELSTHFELKDSGEPQWLLGMKIEGSKIPSAQKHI